MYLYGYSNFKITAITQITECLPGYAVVWFSEIWISNLNIIWFSFYCLQFLYSVLHYVAGDVYLFLFEN